MADTVKEEEFRDDEGLDEHHDAGCDDGQKGDNVQSPKNVQNDETWSSQGIAATGPLEATHYAEMKMEGEQGAV